MNNDNHKDYQTVLEEQTPLVCNNAVENKSSSTRLATLLCIGIAVFAFLAMAGQHVSHLNNISQLKAALADHQSRLQALTVQSTPLLGTALQGASDAGDMCATCDTFCKSGLPKAAPVKILSKSGYRCEEDKNCASGHCVGNFDPMFGLVQQCL